jgi:hypothetical protein
MVPTGDIMIIIVTTNIIRIPTIRVIIIGEESFTRIVWKGEIATISESQMDRIP